VEHVIAVTELPVGVWTEDCKAYLDTLCAGDKEKNIKPIPESFDDLCNYAELLRRNYG
jgi:hypothetical protein